MTRDASLTEFGVGGDDAEAKPAATAPESGTDDDDEATAAGGASIDGDRTADGPDPVRPTSCWSTDPRPCAACGTRVQRAWTDGDRLYCADCKEW